MAKTARACVVDAGRVPRCDDVEDLGTPRRASVTSAVLRDLDAAVVKRECPNGVDSEVRSVAGRAGPVGSALARPRGAVAESDAAISMAARGSR